MEDLKIVRVVVVALGIIMVSGFRVQGQQISTPCKSSMIATFTPCLNLITGSSGGASSPTAGCCDSLKSLMSTSMDCACLIVTANVPLPLNVNRTLSLGLPRACNMGGVPVQCKAAGTPLPAPGPVPSLLSPPPFAASPLSPEASKAAATTPAPAPAIALAPEAPADGPLGRTANPGIRPLVQPSPPSLAHAASPSLALVLFFAIFNIFRCY